MELKNLRGKQIRLTSVSGEQYTGTVCDYFYPEDNEPEVEAIAIDYPERSDGYKYKNPVVFNAPEIANIELI